MTKDEIKPSEMLAFAEALDGSRGMLDAWLECHDEAEVRAYIQQHVKQAEAAERERAKAEVERLRAALTGLVDFVDGPAEAKRPDVFALRMNSARAALKEPK